MEEYKSVSREARSEFTEKKSRFIGSCAPPETWEEARAFIAKIRAEFPDAGHHVTAFINRTGSEMRFDDDGEPKGTGGIPVLEVLKKEDLKGLCVVVTRYFGGILLGAGGLSRAYAKAARDAVEAAGVCTFSKFSVLRFCLDYSLAAKAEYELSRRKISLLEKDFGGAVAFRVLCSETDCNWLDSFLQDITGGKVKTEFIEHRFAKK